MKYEEFERIYQEYYLKILTFIHKRVPDLYEAEELTGDVFLSFYRNMDSYDEEKGSIATWLYAITANRLKNYYRDKKTHYSLEILKQQTIPREKMPEEIVAKIMREETLRKRNRACEDCRNNFIALVKERLDHSAGRIIRLHVLENFFAADHIEIIRAGQDRIKRVGFVHQ